jgi:hypothetical protein
MRLPLVTLALLAAACDSWGPAYQQAWSVLPPVALDGRVAFVETTNARAFILDPADLSARPRIEALPASPVVAVRRSGHDDLIVLSRGERGGVGVAPEGAALTVLSADPARPPVSVALASRFARIDQSADGRFVLASFGDTPPAGEALFNPNELAVIDLGATNPASKTVATARTLRSYGTVPAAVTFSPPMKLAGGPRTLAVIFAENFVTRLDVEHPTRPEITIGLTLPPDDRRTLRPAQVVFDPDDPALYLRATGANDIYALRLVAVPDAERTADGNDFRPALSLLAAGTGPADMALYDSSDGRRLLVVSPGSTDASVIDAHTSRSTRIPLDAPANRILLFDAAAPGDVTIRPHALLIGPGLSASAISFLDLDQLEVQRARNLDSRPMGAAAAQAFFFRERGQALVLHRPQAGAPGLSVIDLSRRTVAPIFAETAPTQVTLGPAASDKVWIGSAESERLGFVSLASLSPGEVRLDDPVAAVLPVPHPSDGRPRVVVVHPSTAGSLTVLDADHPDRASARTVAGFLLTDLLDREEK